MKLMIGLLAGFIIGVVAHERDMLIHQIGKDGILKPLFFDEYKCELLKDIK